ncbi:MAG: hypothetical protein F6K17_34840, partial [Okeania sp. SIO3C4]|nr:hypothetical protein [Okeania sp. SIO3C4]
GIIIISVSLFTENKESLERRVLDRVNSCEEDKCFLSIKDLTEFDWDSLYIFDYYTSEDEIEEIIGCKLKDYNEKYSSSQGYIKLVIFKFENKIIYLEEWRTHISNIPENEIIFASTGNSYFKSYSIDSSVFIVEKIKLKENKYYYRLSPIDGIGTR